MAASYCTDINKLWETIVNQVGVGWSWMGETEREAWKRCLSLKESIVGEVGRKEWIFSFVSFGNHVDVRWCTTGGWVNPSPATLSTQKTVQHWENVMAKHSSVSEQVATLANNGDQQGLFIVNRAAAIEEMIALDKTTLDNLRAHRQAIAESALFEVDNDPHEHNKENQPSAATCDPFPDESSKSLMHGLVSNPTQGRLVPRKKMRQLKLKQALKRKNFQKYPLEKCNWETNVGRHVYQPPKYVSEFKREELEHSVCCTSCYLKPCIVLSKEDILVKSVRSGWNPSSTAHNLLYKYFGINYMKRMKLTPVNKFQATMPECIEKGLAEIRIRVAAKEVNRNDNV